MSAPSKGDNPVKKQEQLPGSFLFSYILFIRLINALTTKTFFQPDEYYQSIEPAHKLTFGYGYLTWEWTAGLRSSLIPILYHLGFSAVKQITKCIPFQNAYDRLEFETQMVVSAPKIISAIAAAIGEYFLYKFARKVSKDEVVARFAIGLSLTNAFNWFIITRSFSNSLEMTLTSIGLYYWPWFTHGSNSDIVIGDLIKSCVFGITSCIIRPSNALIWCFLGIIILYNSNWPLKIKISLVVTFELAAILLMNIYADYKFYGDYILPWKNFIEFNIIKSLSIFYGSNPWHFYLSQGIPLILLTNIPFFVYYMAHNWKKQLSLCAIFVIFIFSLIKHKEFRFIYPLQPLFILFSSFSFAKLYKSIGFGNFRIIVIIIIAINMMVGYFASQINERGVIDVIEYLRDDPLVESFGFLTPCHSTPWQSHLHRPEYEENSWFLTCEPPLHLKNIEEISSYMDESDIFFDDPVGFLNQNFPPNIGDNRKGEFKYSWPSHLIFFEPLEETMFEYLKVSQYQECERFFNSYFHWDDRRKGDVIVYCNVYE